MNGKLKESLHSRFARPILFVAVLLVLGGVYSYLQMPTSLFPEVAFPRITLIADAGEQPVSRMMTTVTKPLESAVKKVPGVMVVKSSTSRGSCTIDVFFRWGSDIYALKSQLESRVNEVKGFLPQGTVISTEAMNQSLFPVMGYTLESDTHSRIALRDAGNLIARPLFAQVEGISNVVVRGGKAKEYVVCPDITRMTALGVTPAMIKQALAATNFVAGNGKSGAANRLYLTLTDTRIKDLADLNRVIVKSDGVRTVRLADVARTDLEEQEEFLKINADGRDAVLIDLVKQPGVNLLTFARDVEAKSREVQAQLPPDYKLSPYYDQSLFVGDSIHGVIRTLIEGLLLALLVMVVFLRSWRASTAVMLTIPVTVATSILLCHVAGITVNVMSLGAIAASVGLIIDDAIVIIEQIYREHEEHPGRPCSEVVRGAVRDLFPAMVSSSLSTIVIFIPFSLMSGLAGSFFRELSTTMVLTLVASFFTTWIVLPTLQVLLGFKARRDGTDVAALEERSLRRVRLLTRLYRHPWLMAGLAGLLVAGAVVAQRHLASGFLPELDEGTIVLDYHTPPGTDIEETDRLCRRMEEIILHHPDVATYSRRTALGMAFNTKPANFGDYLIQLKPSRTKSTPQVISELRRQLSAAVPLVTIDFGQRISDLLGDLMSTPKPVEVKLFGDDYTRLQQLAAQAEGVMQNVPGVVDIDNGLVPDGPALTFRPRTERLAEFGISLPDFREQLEAHVGGVPLCEPEGLVPPNPAQAALTGGLQIGSVEDGEQMRRILLRFTPFGENSPVRLRQAPIFLPDGSTRPLSFFCNVEVEPGSIEQRRENLKSCITLTARLDGRDLGSATADLRAALRHSLSLPQGYSLSFGGAYEAQQQSFHELMLILGLAVLLVFGVQLFLFRRWGVSVAVLLVSVLGLGGSLIALGLTGVPLNVSSYTGMIMVVGIIAENAVFTLWQFRTNRLAGGTVGEAVDYAIALRIRPKLMTAIGAVLALLPLALGLNTGAQMQQPLAVAVIGGLLAGLPLLLLVLPALMLRIFREDGRKGRPGFLRRCRISRKLAPHKNPVPQS